MSSKSFYSKGKLMLCGEYAVLDGATAFALPCKKGQHLTVTEGEESDAPILLWKALDKNKETWFEAEISLPYLFIQNTSDQTVAIQLIRFLINANVLNPKFLRGNRNISVETILEFDADEGLGSSSTLTYNIAQWAGINPYKLHFSAFKGSGFDIAVAKEAKPLLYTMHADTPVVETVNWDIPFADKLFFIHLNKKQNSRDQIAAYKSNLKPALLAQISRISRLLSVNKDYFEFCLLIELAENEMGKILNQLPVKQRLFNDFQGSIKSLGAWGGDYILATGKDTETYFKAKGYSRIVPFQDMIC